MIEDTSKRDPAMHLMGAMGEGPSEYIHSMEASGGRQFAAEPELMPARGPWGELVELGFAEPEPTDDELFVRTRLPQGWTKRTLDDPRGGEIVDDRGVPRVATFYKAAFYDRKADCYVISPGHHLATDSIYGDGPAVLPEQWGVLTTEERDDYRASLDGYLEHAREYPDIYGDRVGRVRTLREASTR